jgi:hypothetical protein
MLSIPYLITIVGIERSFPKQFGLRLTRSDGADTGCSVDCEIDKLVLFAYTFATPMKPVTTSTSEFIARILHPKDQKKGFIWLAKRLQRVSLIIKVLVDLLFRVCMSLRRKAEPAYC